MNKLTIHCRIRDEVHTVGFGIASVAEHVHEVLVTDTGSTDGTWELVQDLSLRYPNLKLKQDHNVPDSRQWGFDASGRLNYPLLSHGELMRVRNEHIEDTKTEWCWILDGDEIYCEQTIQDILDFMAYVPDNCIGLYLPFNHFTQDRYHTARGFPLYGRLFRVDKLSVRGKTPHEQHYYGEEWIGSNTPGVFKLDTQPVCHMQMVTKPWRRVPVGVKAYGGLQPEVFDREDLIALKEKHARPESKED